MINYEKIACGSNVMKDKFTENQIKITKDLIIL